MSLTAWAISALLGPGGARGVAPRPDGQPAGTGPLAAGEVARYMVTAAVWAPSVHNTQPWRFTAGGRQISLRRRWAAADGGRPRRPGDDDQLWCGAVHRPAGAALTWVHPSDIGVARSVPVAAGPAGELGPAGGCRSATSTWAAAWGCCPAAGHRPPPPRFCSPPATAGPTGCGPARRCTGCWPTQPANGCSPACTPSRWNPNLSGP